MDSTVCQEVIRRRCVDFRALRRRFFIDRCKPGTNAGLASVLRFCGHSGLYSPVPKNTLLKNWLVRS